MSLPNVKADPVQMLLNQLEKDLENAKSKEEINDIKKLMKDIKDKYIPKIEDIMKYLLEKIKKLSKKCIWRKVFIKMF